VQTEHVHHKVGDIKKRQEKYLALYNEMNAYVLQRLEQLSTSCEIPQDFAKKHSTTGSTNAEVDTEELQILIDEYEMRAQNTQNLPRSARNNLEEFHEGYQEAAAFAFALERDEIALQYEKGNITHTKMRELRQNVDLMEFAISPNAR
jgi:hypothetical protein